MSSQRDEVMAAITKEDWTELDRLDWKPIVTSLRDFWAKRFSLDDAAAYATVLADHEPGLILAAIQAAAAEGTQFRPVPSQLAARLAPPVEAATGGRHGQPTRPDQSAEAHAAVRHLYETGTHECVCIPHPPNWHQTIDGALLCIDCDGLETGQLDDALGQ